MIRRVAAAAAVTVVVACTGSPLLAGRDTDKTTYACGTVLGKLKRVDGRVDTWNLSALRFTPDSRASRPVLIRYKSITRIEYGRTPPRLVESKIMLPCGARWPDDHVTIFYKEVAPIVEDDQKKKDPSEPRNQEEKDKLAREERRDRLDQKDLKNPQEQRRDEKLKEEKEDLLKAKEHFAAFELGDGVRVDTLRILETRSGRRIFYQDAAARRSAR